MEVNNDNKEKIEEMQPKFETIPVDENSKKQPLVEETPEEVTTPEELTPINETPVYKESVSPPFLFIGLGIVIFIFLLLIFSSLFSSKKTKKPINLIYWGLWEEKEIFQPLIDEYQKKNPNIKITYQKMSPENYREKLIVRSKNNQGPDIFRFHNTWIPEIKEVLSPLPSSVMTNNEFENTFYEVYQKDLKVGRYYYGIPLYIDNLVMIYNRSLFKKAGILKEPSTWEDILDIVPKLTVKDLQGNLITAGIAIGTANNIEHFSDIFALFLIQNGADLKNLNTQEAVSALEAYRKFAEPPNQFWTEDMPNSINAFIQEKVAIIFVPSWQILNIKVMNPELDFKVTTVPVIPGGKNVSIANYWVEGVSRFSKNQIEAWKFLKYLSEKENLTKLYEIQSRSRLFGTAYSRKDLANLLIQNEYLGPVIKQADNLISISLISRTSDNGLNDSLIKYLENAINSTIQGVSYQEALKTMSQGVNQIFNQYNIN